MLYYLNHFLIYSIVGFLLETGVGLFTNMSGSGILYGPWTPVYGFGVVVILLLEKWIFKKREWPRWMKIFLLLCSVFVLLSFLEWLGGTLIELLFHEVFWDYSSYPFPLGKYVSLPMSLLWAVLSLVFVYLLQPLTDRLLKKIPSWLSLTVLVLFLADFLVTFFVKLK